MRDSKKTVIIGGVFHATKKKSYFCPLDKEQKLEGAFNLQSGAKDVRIIKVTVDCNSNIRKKRDHELCGKKFAQECWAL